MSLLIISEKFVIGKLKSIKNGNLKLVSVTLWDSVNKQTKGSVFLNVIQSWTIHRL